MSSELCIRIQSLPGGPGGEISNIANRFANLSFKHQRLKERLHIRMCSLMKKMQMQDFHKELCNLEAFPKSTKECNNLERLPKSYKLSAPDVGGTPLGMSRSEAGQLGAKCKREQERAKPDDNLLRGNIVQLLFLYLSGCQISDDPTFRSPRPFLDNGTIVPLKETWASYCLNSVGDTPGSNHLTKNSQVVTLADAGIDRNDSPTGGPGGEISNIRRWHARAINCGVNKLDAERKAGGMLAEIVRQPRKRTDLSSSLGDEDPLYYQIIKWFTLKYGRGDVGRC